MKKKGMYEVVLTDGGDDDLSVVTNQYQEDDLVADAFVVICKEGVAGPDGKEVKRNKV